MSLEVMIELLQLLMVMVGSPFLVGVIRKMTARFEYTATAFANPFKRVFALLYRPVKVLDVEFHPESRYFVRTIEYSNEGRLIFEDTLYRPLLRMIDAIARRARVLQSGNVHGYLVYILIALIALLILAV